MGKNKGNNRNQAPPAGATATATARTPATLISPKVDPVEAAIREAHEAAAQIATDGDLRALSSDPRPAGASVDRLWEIAREARDLFRAATTRVNQATAACEQQSQALDRKEAVLAAH